MKENYESIADRTHSEASTSVQNQILDQLSEAELETVSGSQNCLRTCNLNPYKR